MGEKPGGYFDEARWADFLRARQRRSLALERGADECFAEVVFLEWFVQATEGETSGRAKVEVAALLGAMRLERGRAE